MCVSAWHCKYLLHHSILAGTTTHIHGLLHACFMQHGSLPPTATKHPTSLHWKQAIHTNLLSSGLQQPQ